MIPHLYFNIQELELSQGNAIILVNIFVHFISFHDAKISEYKVALGPKG